MVLLLMVCFCEMYDLACRWESSFDLCVDDLLSEGGPPMGMALISLFCPELSETTATTFGLGGVNSWGSLAGGFILDLLRVVL